MLPGLWQTGQQSARIGLRIRGLQKRSLEVSFFPTTTRVRALLTQIMSALITRLSLLGLMLLAASAHAQQGQASLLLADCGDPFNNGSIAPYDYNDPEARSNSSKIPIIEAAHFTRSVETLERGNTTVYVLGDLDFMLRAIPNHHRALYAAVRYELRAGKPDPNFRSAECWLQRAATFRPKDGTVRMIYGIFLARTGQQDRALAQYQEALRLAPGSPETHYNVGLLMFDMRRYGEAKKHADIADRLGYPLQGLRRKLATVASSGSTK
jgi:tetratricopeptide (TPR) repeat protein